MNAPRAVRVFEGVRGCIASRLVDCKAREGVVLKPPLRYFPPFSLLPSPPQYNYIAIMPLSRVSAYASYLAAPLSSLAPLCRPQLVNGIWRKPHLSARKIAEIRKAALGT
jgi:hypothetical protein